MSKPDFIPAKWLPELLRTIPSKAARLVAAGAFPVLQPNPAAHRDREVLLAGVERHVGREISEAELADAVRRYAERMRRQDRFTRDYRARMKAAAAAGDPDAVLKEALRLHRQAEQARRRRLAARSEAHA